MEFRIQTQGTLPDLDAIRAALIAIDPMALVDIDRRGATLMVSALMGSPELLDVLTRAGWPVSFRQLEEVPSVCCGACGG